MALEAEQISPYIQGFFENKPKGYRRILILTRLTPSSGHQGLVGNKTKGFRSISNLTSQVIVGLNIENPKGFRCMYVLDNFYLL